MGGGEKRTMVEIVVKTIGPGRPSTLRIPSPITVCDLRRSVAAEGRHPLDQLKLVFRGQTLLARKRGEDAVVDLHDGDTLIVAVVPTPPAKHLHDGYDDEDDDDLKFHVPESEIWWKRKLFSFLKERLKFPDILLMAIFSISLKAWAGIVLWFAMAPVAYRWDVGPLYILGTGFSIILLNLGRRQHGDSRFYCSSSDSLFTVDFTVHRQTHCSLSDSLFTTITSPHLQKLLVNLEQ